MSYVGSSPADEEILTTLDLPRAGQMDLIEWTLALRGSDRSGNFDRILPLATGTGTFGAFEGRTPCQGIAHEIAIEPPGNCVKVKWRVTLYQDARSAKPTTYRIKGSLHRLGAREGTWSLARGTSDKPKASVIRLSATADESAAHLLVGDTGVLFFLDESGKPFVGHACTATHSTEERLRE